MVVSNKTSVVTPHLKLYVRVVFPGLLQFPVHCKIPPAESARRALKPPVFVGLAVLLVQCVDDVPRELLGAERKRGGKVKDGMEFNRLFQGGLVYLA